MSDIAEKLMLDSMPAFRKQVKDAVELMSKSCESPIEVLLGASLCIGLTKSCSYFGRATMVVGNGDFLPGGHPNQWQFICQYKWQKYRIDFALFTQLPYPVFVECDGHDFHERTKDQAQRDREKDRTIQAAGIPILRFTGSEIHRSPLRCTGQIVNLVLDRLRDVRAPRPQFTPGTPTTAEAVH